MKDNEREYYLGDKKLPIGSIKQEYTPEMIKEMLACAKDIIRFTKYFYITSLEHGKEKIKLYRPQKRLVKALVKYRFNIILSSRQIGKALDVNTPIPSPDGWKTMGELIDGDRVYDTNGGVCNVVKAHNVLYNRNCYELKFDNGETIIADEGHRWFTQTKTDRSKKSKNKGSVKTTKDIVDTIKKWGESNHRIKLPNALKGEHKNLPIDPYLLGYWLSDGRSNASRIWSHTDDAYDFVENIKENYVSVKHSKENTYRIDIKGKNKRDPNSFYMQLKNNNLFNNKHIPFEYLYASKEQRLALIQGILDADGHITKKGRCELSLSNKKLFDDCVKLLQTMGYKLHISVRKTKCNDSHRVGFVTTDNVFKLKRKADRLPTKIREDATHLYIVSAKKIATRPVRCITVDSENSLFLCGNTYIPTSNTTVTTIYALWVACFNKDKTILIVANKEDTAKEILLRIKMAYEQLPNWLKPGVEEWAKTEVKFTNDSRISISTTSSSAARGLSINCVDGSSIVTLKDKTSGDIFDMSMKDFHELLEKDGELLPVSLVED